VMHGQANIR